MKIQRCKGTRDLSPSEMVRFRRIEDAFRDYCLGWGYEEVRTPTLEYLHLFTSTGTLTPGMLGRVYSFLDWDGWSGERVVLRPDGTIPVARFYIDAQKKRGQSKLFYVANVFVFEETGKESRERWQCGVELIGTGSNMADVELMTMSLEILSKLGLTGVEVKLSHAGLIRAILIKLGLSPREQERIFDQILDGDMKALAGIKSIGREPNRGLMKLLKLKGKSSGLLKNLRATTVMDIPELEPALDDFTRIVELVESLGYEYQIDVASGRGFEYYTGVIFQLFVGGKKVGGGGRYDGLIPVLGGPDIGASGFALYVDRLMNLIAPEDSAGTEARRILVKAEQSMVKEGFGVARALREAGYVTELDLGAGGQADSRWILEVQGKAPLFVLTDVLNSARFEGQTASDILDILTKETGRENSST
ncbi:MAG: histidine--tRNA ligase family protein [Chloroflexi bacterium]|nr:histidine--tRNA ligase family protein [Chloroflexota bacterium]